MTFVKKDHIAFQHYDMETYEILKAQISIGYMKWGWDHGENKL